MSDLRELNNVAHKTAEMIVHKWGNESSTPYGKVAKIGRMGDVYSISWQISGAHPRAWISFTKDSLPSSGGAIASMKLTLQAVERLELIAQYFASADVTKEIEGAIETLIGIQKVLESKKAQ